MASVVIRRTGGAQCLAFRDGREYNPRFVSGEAKGMPNRSFIHPLTKKPKNKAE